MTLKDIIFQINDVASISEERLGMGNVSLFDDPKLYKEILKEIKLALLWNTYDFLKQPKDTLLAEELRRYIVNEFDDDSKILDKPESEWR